MSVSSGHKLAKKNRYLVCTRTILIGTLSEWDYKGLPMVRPDVPAEYNTKSGHFYGGKLPNRLCRKKSVPMCPDVPTECIIRGHVGTLFLWQEYGGFRVECPDVPSVPRCPVLSTYIIKSIYTLKVYALLGIVLFGMY